MDYIKDLAAALAVLLNCIPGMMLAVSMGYSMAATTFGVAAGSIGMAALGYVSPISFQPESLILLNQTTGERTERIMITGISSVILLLLGVTGMVEHIVDVIGQGAMCALLAGMGVMIVRVAFDMQKQRKPEGAASVISAAIVYLLTKDLIYTIIISCIISTVVHIILSRKNKRTESVQERVQPELAKPVFNARVLSGILSLTVFQIVSIIAYGTVNAQLAGISAGSDGFAAYLGLGNIISSLFSGAALAPVISATASAPHPVLSAVMFAVLLVMVLRTGLLQNISEYVPQQCICGFLFVLGALVMFPDNAVQAITISPLAAGITIGTTAFLGPVYGVALGLAAFRLYVFL